MAYNHDKTHDGWTQLLLPYDTTPSQGKKTQWSGSDWLCVQRCVAACASAATASDCQSLPAHCVPLRVHEHSSLSPATEPTCHDLYVSNIRKSSGCSWNCMQLDIANTAVTSQSNTIWQSDKTQLVSSKSVVFGLTRMDKPSQFSAVSTYTMFIVNGCQLFQVHLTDTNSPSTYVSTGIKFNFAIMQDHRWGWQN